MVCKIFHTTTGLKKVVTPSYAPSSLMSIAAEQHRGFLESSTLPPVMDYDVLLSLAPPPLLPATFVYQMLAIWAGSSMMVSMMLHILVYIFLHEANISFYIASNFFKMSQKHVWTNNFLKNESYIF